MRLPNARNSCIHGICFEGDRIELSLGANFESMAANCSSVARSPLRPFLTPLPARMRVTYLSEAAKARERRKKERKLSIRLSADETEGAAGGARER